MFHKNKLIRLLTVAIAAVFFVAGGATAANASDRYYGGDYSKYQTNVFNNTGHDSFAIDQIGGDVNGYIYEDWTYSRHAQQARNNGWRFHTYIWDQTGSNSWETQRMLNYFLPRLQQPKGAIVALDFEAGASWSVEGNTDAILTGMRQIRDSGYTPMLYSYRPYLLAHVDVNRVLTEFPNSLWVAGYQNGLSVWPNYSNFPSMPGVAIWQYSDYGGQQDLNVDLTGITRNGYSQQPQAQPKQQPAQHPNNTPNTQPAQSNTSTYTVKYGDSWWAIANRYGMNMYQLASINGRSISSVIYPGQTLRIRANVQTNQQSKNSGSTWRDALGDVWHKENGTFTANTWLNLRWGARTSSARIALLNPGSTVKYDAWSNHGGYIWVRQPRQNGYGYVAVRNSATHEAFGSFK